MTWSKHQSSLLGLVDSDTEEGLSVVLAATKTSKAKASGREPKMPPKKATRGRTAANKVSKPTQSSSVRQKPEQELKKPDKAAQLSGPGRGRRAKAKTKVVPDSQPPPEHVPPPKKARGRPKAIKAADPELSVKDVSESPKPIRGRSGRAAKKPDPNPDESQETEHDPEADPQPDVDGMDIDILDEDEEVDGLPAPPQRAQSFSGSRQPQLGSLESVSRRPQASLEQGTATADPALRRRLGDLTQKYDSLELKYRDLREIGVKEAERNFDKLKKHSEERTNTANQLITSLKAELASQTALAKEGFRTRNQLDESDSKVGELETMVDELTTALHEAKSEIKTLNTKLAASRTAEVANPRYPGSALKNGVSAARQAASNDAAQLGQVKGELYCDLTGLIITGVKRDGEEDIFDCIQTGRNGSESCKILYPGHVCHTLGTELVIDETYIAALHFKLGVANENSADSFEDAEFLYKPQLDPNRDRALIEMLPDYLRDEITFTRPQASKFYARVMKALTELGE
ncbi:hypothetical protein MKZ38_003616 [Zalerion maritima]|uniref:Monopolin complex subunit Csm1/Pcs1 C-terminal domain-containing protein n=1 Tax=Zalerion maritima TaxID=339359 RepID=A0AAD5RNR2_9PEZI|nr:hypothetical protein MKZ38_003616 [Zalerion maritima]